MPDKVIRRALSIRQPWAVLVVKKIKPIETRTRRAPAHIIGTRVYIQASLTIDRAPLKVIELSAPYHLATGTIIGSGILVECREYRDRELWVADADKHLNCIEWFEPPLYGYCFEDIEEFEAVPCRGYLGFFEVPDSVILP